MENTNMNKQMVLTLRNEAMAALQAVAERHGLQVTVNKMSLGTGNCAIGFEFAQVTGGVTQTRTASAFTRFANVFGLEPSDLGKVFTCRGTEYRITGLATGRSKTYPILAERVSDSRGFKFAAVDVKRNIKGAM